MAINSLEPEGSVVAPVPVLASAFLRAGRAGRGCVFGVAVAPVPLLPATGARPVAVDCAFAPASGARHRLKTSARLKKLRIKSPHKQWPANFRPVVVFPIATLHRSGASG